MMWLQRLWRIFVDVCILGNLIVASIHIYNSEYSSASVSLLIALFLHTQRMDDKINKLGGK